MIYIQSARQAFTRLKIIGVRLEWDKDNMADDLSKSGDKYVPITIM